MPDNDQQTLATALAEVSDRVTLLVREELELARAEVERKAKTIAKGAGVALAAGIFISVGLMFLLHGAAWLTWYVLPTQKPSYFWGFFVVAGVLFILGGLSGWLASKWLKAGPPTPDMAIDEAKKIRETVESATTKTTGT